MVLLSFYFIFRKFQPGVACKNVAFLKKAFTKLAGKYDDVKSLHI